MNLRRDAINRVSVRRKVIPMYADSLRNQTQQIFQNIELVFEDLDSSLFSKKSGGFFIWKQMYHMIHSLDKHFIDPSSFQEPPIQEKNLDVIYLDRGKELSRETIFDYYRDVSKKIKAYLSSLNDQSLEETVTVNNSNYTRLELIIAQLRHVFYHIGYLHCCIKNEKGRTPEYIGLYVRVPEE